RFLLKMGVSAVSCCKSRWASPGMARQYATPRNHLKAPWVRVTLGGTSGGPDPETSTSDHLGSREESPTWVARQNRQHLDGPAKRAYGSGLMGSGVWPCPTNVAWAVDCIARRASNTQAPSRSNRA